MRIIKPNTTEYRQGLICLIEFRFSDALKVLKLNPSFSIQIINEGDELEEKNNVLNFLRYESVDKFILFPMFG